MTYKLKDLQGQGLKENHIFNSKAEVIENLASFHNADYEGQRDDGTRYKDIYEFLDTLKSPHAQLEFLLDYGEWELIANGINFEIKDMKNDKQIIHHLWWLRGFLDTHFAKKEYKEMIYKDLDTDTIKELDELVAYIKANY